MGRKQELVGTTAIKERNIMGLKQILQERIAQLQADVSILNSVSEDVFPFGTIAVFTANSGSTKWYYVKVGEELWRRMSGGSEEKELSVWILESKGSNIGYFEVYILRVDEVPFYASA